MVGYFKPGRRKIGVLTLVMACVLMAGWVRSLQVVDEIELSTGSFGWVRLFSADGEFTCSFGLEDRQAIANWNTGSRGDLIGGHREALTRHTLRSKQIGSLVDQIDLCAGEGVSVKRKRATDSHGGLRRYRRDGRHGGGLILVTACARCG